MRKLFAMILIAAPLFTLDTAALAKRPKVVVVTPAPVPAVVPPPVLPAPAPVVQVHQLPPPRVVVEQPVPPPATVAVVGAPVAAGYYGGTMQVQGVVVAPVAPVMQVSAEAYPPPQQVVVAGPPCNQMDDGSLQALTGAIQAESFSSGQLRVISDAAQGSCFSVAQVAAILPLLSFEDDKLKALQLLSHNIWDRQNAFRIYSLFTFEASKEKARHILSR